MSSWVRWVTCLAVATVVLVSCARKKTVRTEIDLGTSSVKLDEPDLNTLIASAADPDPEVRFWGVLTLATLGPKAEPALSVLTKALGDSNGNIRSSAADALGKIGPKAAPA